MIQQGIKNSHRTMTNIPPKVSQNPQVLKLRHHHQQKSLKKPKQTLIMPFKSPVSPLSFQQKSLYSATVKHETDAIPLIVDLDQQSEQRPTSSTATR